MKKLGRYNLVQLFLDQLVVKNTALGLTYEVIYVPPKLVNDYKRKQMTTVPTKKRQKV